MTITTRRSTRNLQQASLDSELSCSENDSQRDYTLNYERALLKKLSACNTDLKVQSEFKHGNFVFTFSAGMYELTSNSLDNTRLTLTKSTRVSVSEY